MTRKGMNDYEVQGETTVLFIRNGKSIIIDKAYIDTEDLDKLIELNVSWSKSYNPSSNRSYVCATHYLGSENGKIKHKTLKLHKVLFDNRPYARIDHIDHNAMNNRKSNLRITTVCENSRHREALNSNNKTGYRNVCFINGWYVVQLQINKKCTRLGKFKDIDEAGVFAEEMRKKYYGDYAGN